MPLTIQTLVVGELSANCYFLTDPDTRSTLIVDPGDAPEYISDQLLHEKLHPVCIIATHGHFDHIMGVFGLMAFYGIPFYLHQEDTFLAARMQETGRHFLKRNNIDPNPVVTQYVFEGMTISVGSQTVSILHVPGHTPGSIAVSAGNALFIGDAFFADGSYGRTDRSYAREDLLERSVRRMIHFKGVTVLYPGHGEPIPVDRAKAMFGV